MAARGFQIFSRTSPKLISVSSNIIYRQHSVSRRLIDIKGARVCVSTLKSALSLPIGFSSPYRYIYSRAFFQPLVLGDITHRGNVQRNKLLARAYTRARSFIRRRDSNAVTAVCREEKEEYNTVYSTALAFATYIYVTLFERFRRRYLFAIGDVYHYKILELSFSFFLSAYYIRLLVYIVYRALQQLRSMP